MPPAAWHSYIRQVLPSPVSHIFCSFEKSVSIVLKLLQWRKAATFFRLSLKSTWNKQSHLCNIWTYSINYTVCTSIFETASWLSEKHLQWHLQPKKRCRMWMVLDYCCFFAVGSLGFVRLQLWVAAVAQHYKHSQLTITSSWIHVVCCSISFIYHV